MSESGCDYGAHIKVNTDVLQNDLIKLRSSLAAVNWAMRALGVSPEMRQAIMQIQRAIYILNILRMLSQGGGIMSAARMGLSFAGLGQVTGGIRAVRTVIRLSGD